jgi:hypothetical protein
MLHPAWPVPRPASSAPVLGAFLLVAAVLQFMASVALGQATTEKLARAAAEGARMYLIGGLAMLVGLVGVWSLRRRPLVAAGVLVVWQAAVLLPLRSRTSRLGLAYHGEFVLHHFAALLAAAICVLVAIDLARRHELGRARFVPVVLALSGTALAVAAHVWTSRPEHGAAIVPGWATPATLLLLSAWLSLPAIAWRRLHPVPLRIAGLFLALPYVVRLAVGGKAGLTGGVVPPEGRAFVMTAIVLGGVAVFVLVRPRLTRGLRVLVTLSSFVAVAMLYLVYRQGFGELEDDLGGLAISVFGFVPPYPPYVPAWQSLVVMLGLFGLFTAAYGSLIAKDERPRGVALALVVATGIGLTSPQLWLMAGAAGLLFYGSLPAAVGHARPPAEPIEDLLRDAAARLGLPEPVVLETESGALLSMRGDVKTRRVELRARPLPQDAWSLELSVGVHGRGRAEVELVPDPGEGGARPAHVLSRTHAVRGERRAAERLDDALLDAIVPLPDARVELWPAGARVDLGQDLSALTADRVAALVQALVRHDLRD